MASGPELLVDAYRGLGSSARNLGVTLERDQERRKKEDAEAERKRRLEELFGQVPDLAEAVKGEDFDAAAYASHPAVQAGVRESILSGDPNVMRSFDPFAMVTQDRSRAEQARLDRESKERQAAAKAAAKAAEKAEKPTKGQDSLDKEFGKEVKDWSAAGGFTGVQKNLEQLREVSRRLKAGRADQDPNNPVDPETLSGPVTGLLPDWFAAFVNPESVDVRETVHDVASQSLKAVLGGAFGEREGEMLIKRSYNPQLSEEENAKRVDRTIKQISTMARAKQEAVDYFKANNGTLKGYEPTIKYDKQDVLDDKDPPKIPEERGSSAADNSRTPKKIIVAPDSPAFQKLQEEHGPAFRKVLDSVNAQRAAQNLPPLTEEEEAERFKYMLNKLNISVPGLE